MDTSGTDTDIQWLAESLRVIRDRSSLVGTCYFEIVPSDSTSPKCWSDDSLYISDTGFNFLHAAFARADAEFDYYAFNRFDSLKVSKLILELAGWEAEVEEADDCKVLRHTFLGRFEVDSWNRYSWPLLKPMIVHSTREVRAFIESHKRSHPYLWVLGM